MRFMRSPKSQRPTALIKLMPKVAQGQGPLFSPVSHYACGFSIFNVSHWRAVIMQAKQWGESRKKGVAKIKPQKTRN